MIEAFVLLGLFVAMRLVVFYEKWIVLLRQLPKAVDVEKERSRIAKEKRQHISQTIRLNADLKSLLGKS